MPRITITISPTGQTVVATSGYRGKSCQDATRQLERALGSVASESKTSEFYQTQADGQHVQQRQ
jgi:hypothetical protein